ncbi:MULTISPECIES: hypothetical protein [unclassified Clostridioides]
MDKTKNEIQLITKIVNKVYHKEMIDFYKHYNLSTRNGDPEMR